jgi:trehalose synthase
MLVTVPISAKALADYEIFVEPGAIQDIRETAGELAGARVMHINATAYGGGVAELLYTQVPLLQDAGLLADWKVIQGSEEFFSVTKIMHNSLQGMEIPVTDQMKKIYEHHNQANAKLLEGHDPYDFIIVHDPQPAALPFFLKDRYAVGKKWIWRCHLDLTKLSRELWDYLLPFIQLYDAVIFTSATYANDYVSKLPPVSVIMPSIDPLSPKNSHLDDQTVARTLRKYHIDPDRPLVTQVSRYDPWKDPLGVIDAYRMVKKEVPDLILLLAASMASDDPESWHYYEKTARWAGPDPDIILLSNLQGVGNLEINAFQRGSDIIMQKSLQEGFGLTVAEALWKEKAVIGGNAGGITLQIEDGANGFLVNSVDECAERLLYLLKHPQEARRLGAAGRDKVRQKFLSTVNLKAYLDLFRGLAVAEDRREKAQAAQRNT